VLAEANGRDASGEGGEVMRRCTRERALCTGIASNSCATTVGGPAAAPLSAWSSIGERNSGAKAPSEIFSSVSQKWVNAASGPVGGRFH
jgi:hypothetical protein